MVGLLNTQGKILKQLLHFKSLNGSLGEPKRIVLETLPFGIESHTGVNISNKIISTLIDWKMGC